MSRKFPVSRYTFDPRFATPFDLSAISGRVRSVYRCVHREKEKVGSLEFTLELKSLR